MKFTILLALSILVKSSFSDSWECENGILYQENNCRWCVCVLGLMSSCMDVLCSGDEYYSLKQCKIGSMWKQDCNDCVCLREYGQVCTVKECFDKGGGGGGGHGGNLNINIQDSTVNAIIKNAKSGLINKLPKSKRSYFGKVKPSRFHQRKRKNSNYKT